MILIDSHKAFDTVNHNILLTKIDFIEFSEKTTKCFKSYMSNRKFKVHIKSSSHILEPLMESSSRIHFRTTPFSVLYK